MMDYTELNAKQISAILEKMEIDNLKNEIHILSSDTRSSVLKLVTRFSKKIERHQHELDRLKELSRYENKLHSEGIHYVAGVDEVGRGPLAGPVFAAAVILDPDVVIEGINDSKKLSEKKREQLSDIIKEKAVAYSIASVSENEIDEINIRNAAHKAMVHAVAGLSVQPNHVLVDGDAVNGMLVRHTCIIKGDSLSISIAAASILAKVARDQYIQQFDDVYPEYGFGKHKGYGTPEHIEAIKTYGLCPIHRRSFTGKFVAG